MKRSFQSTSPTTTSNDIEHQQNIIEDSYLVPPDNSSTSLPITHSPTPITTAIPTVTHTAIPTAIPTVTHTTIPTAIPTVTHTTIPTAIPTVTHTTIPTAIPTVTHTTIPTAISTATNSATPTATNTTIPTTTNTTTPTVTNTAIPTVTNISPNTVLVATNTVTTAEKTNNHPIPSPITTTTEKNNNDYPTPITTTATSTINEKESTAEKKAITNNNEIVEERIVNPENVKHSVTNIEINLEAEPQEKAETCLNQMSSLEPESVESVKEPLETEQTTNESSNQKVEKMDVEGIRTPAETVRNENDPNEDYCKFCSATGELICCERCPSAWHPYCVVPALADLPTGTWLCPLCDENRMRVKPVLLSKHIHFKMNGSKGGKTKTPQKKKPDDKDPWWDCLEILQILKKHRKAWPFKEPVDVKKLNVPDYYEMIVLPMDLRTVEKKLYNQTYNNMTDFANDIRLIWANAETFNGPTNEVTLMARQLRQLFEKLFDTKEKQWREHYETMPTTKRRLKNRPESFKTAFKNSTLKETK
jgi:hypothetical protein